MDTTADRAHASSVRGNIRARLGTLAGQSGVYALGLVLSRLASVILLPLYTRVLNPSDYGVLAILDVVQELLRLAVGTGFTTAAGRFHFDTDNESERSRIWWVAVVGIAVAGLAVAVPMFLGRTVLAGMSFGPSLEGGSRLYGIMLASFWFSLPEGCFQSHLAVTGRAKQSVAISLTRLVFNASLNILLLYRFHLGVSGVLLGNLLTAVACSGFHLGLFARLRGRPGFNWSLLPKMASYGGPLIVVALLSLAMHQLDRYILVRYVSLADIGVYSLAYQVAQGVNSLVLSPFGQVWAVVVFQVARLKNADQVFAQIFAAFSRGLMLVLLGASLSSKFVIGLLAPGSYGYAADLVPILALSYYFFSLDDHFRVPAIIAKRTSRLVPVYATAVGLNVALNLLLVPRWGTTGAAVANLGSFAVFSLVGLAMYRRITKIPYDLTDSILVVAGSVLAYGAYRATFGGAGAWVALAGALTIWAATAAVFSVRPVRDLRQFWATGA